MASPLCGRARAQALTGDRTRSLGSFREVFAHFEREKIQATVIGGCAVGAYANTVGVTSLSGDLDVFATPDEQYRLLQIVRGLPGVTIESEPQPGSSIRTLVLKWGELEVDVLVESTGPLPDARVAYEGAWTFTLEDGSTARVLDPFLLLKNKLGVDRDKDQEHIELLNAFLRDLVLARFADSSGLSRKKIETATKYLDALGLSLLPQDLFDELVVAPLDPATRRYLVKVAPSDEMALKVFALAPDEERPTLQRIIDSRSR